MAKRTPAIWNASEPTASATSSAPAVEPGEKKPILIRPTRWPRPSTKKSVMKPWLARKPKKSAAMSVVVADTLFAGRPGRVLAEEVHRTTEIVCEQARHVAADTVTNEDPLDDGVLAVRGQRIRGDLPAAHAHAI